MESVTCNHCTVMGRSCAMLLGDIAAQSLCLQAQGWSRSNRGRKWRCPACTASWCEIPQYHPSDILRLRCGAQHRQEPPPPPPPPPFPPTQQPRQGSQQFPPPPPFSSPTSQTWQWHGGAYAGGSEGSAARSPQSLGGLSPVDVFVTQAFSGVCADASCQAHMGLCSPCMAISSSLPRYPRDPASEPTSLLRSVQNLVQQLNNLPGYCLPRWLVHPTDQEVRVAGRSVRHQDDHGNCAASALLLVMLRPQMFAAGCCGLHPQQPVEWPGRGRGAG